MPDPLKILSAASFFRGASAAARTALAGQARLHEVKKRDILFHEGGAGGSLFLQVSGRSGMMKAGPDGQQACLKVVVPGELFAVVVLFGAAPYPVTAEALEEGLVLELPGGAVRKLLDEPKFRDHFIEALMERQRYLAEQVRRLALDPLEHRLLAFLRDHYGERAELAPVISKKDMAAALGVTPETFSRLLKRLAADGSVVWSGRRIRVSAQAWSGLAFSRGGAEAQGRFSAVGKPTLPKTPRCSRVASSHFTLINSGGGAV